MYRRIYLTHCSGNKDVSLKDSSRCVTPEKMYTSVMIQRFVERCQQERTDWAIFSDHHGVWFPHDRKPYYEKHPSRVNRREFQELLMNFDKNLRKYDEIFFYYNPGRFHRLYRKLIVKSMLSHRIVKFTHLNDIF
jgi:hypothetical protein